MGYDITYLVLPGLKGHDVPVEVACLLRFNEIAIQAGLEGESGEQIYLKDKYILIEIISVLIIVRGDRWHPDGSIYPPAKWQVPGGLKP